MSGERGNAAIVTSIEQLLLKGKTQKHYRRVGRERRKTYKYISTYNFKSTVVFGMVLFREGMLKFSVLKKYSKKLKLKVYPIRPHGKFIKVQGLTKEDSQSILQERHGRWAIHS